MPLAEGVIDSVANSNFKNQGEMPIQYSNILLNDALIAARNVTAIREKGLQKGIERMDTIQEDELGLTGAGINSGLAATLAQILSKLAQTTRPETGA